MQETVAIKAKPLIERVRVQMANRPFLKDVSIMLTGAAGGQAISLLLSPALTRLYSPQEFGTLSVYSAIIAILAVVASLRYELALPLAKTDEDAVNLMAVCLCVLFVTTLILSAIALFMPASLMASLWPIPGDQGPLRIYRLLLVVGYVCLGGYFIALYVATRAGAYRPIAKTRLAQGVVGPTSQIVMALFGLGAPGLLAGS